MRVFERRGQRGKDVEVDERAREPLDETTGWPGKKPATDRLAIHTHAERRC
jgi:hypothetical protein